MNRINSNLFDQSSQNQSFGGRPIMKQYNVSQIKELLNGAKSAFIAVPQTNIDSIGAALALGHLLKKKGLDVKVFTPQKTDNNYSKLSALDLLNDTVGNSDLVVTLEYPLDQIENVSYNDDGGKLNLVVKTKSGAPVVENNQIQINSQSAVADINFMLGDETALGDKAGMVNSGKWVLISPRPGDKSWAKATLVDPDAPFSEIFTFLLPMLDLDLDMDSGKNLLIGLRVATQSFSVNVSPETFEAGAINLRATQPEDMGQPNGFNGQTPIENVESGPAQPGSNTPPSVSTV